MKHTPRQVIEMLLFDLSGSSAESVDRGINVVVGAALAFQMTGEMDSNEASLWGDRARLAGLRRGWIPPGHSPILYEAVVLQRIKASETILTPSATPAEVPSPKPGETRHTPVPDTFDGIRYAVGRMIRMIQDARKDPLVISLARKIAAVASDPPGPAPCGQELYWLRGIHAWCRANFQFVNDPVGIELIQTPNRMLRELQIPSELHAAVWAPIGKAIGGKLPEPKMTGDADEATIISMALAAAVGIEPLRIQFGGADGTAYTCWGQAYVDGKWVDCDILHETFGKHQEVQKFEHLDIPI